MMQQTSAELEAELDDIDRERADFREATHSRSSKTAQRMQHDARAARGSHGGGRPAKRASFAAGA